MNFIESLAVGACVLAFAACGVATSPDAGGTQRQPGSPSPSSSVGVAGPDAPSPPNGAAPVDPSAPCGGAASITLGSGEGVPSAVLVDDARVYWLTHAGAGADGGVKLRAAPKCGGAAVTLATGPYFAEGLAQDDTTLFFATSIGSGQGALLSVPKAGGAVVTLKQGDFRPSGIAVDDSSIYWADAYASSVSKMPKTGGAVTVLATGLSPTGLTHPEHVFVQGDWVYAAGQAGLAKLPIAGGAPTALYGQPIDDVRATGDTLLLASRVGVFAMSLVSGGTFQLANAAYGACASGDQVAFVTGEVVELHRVPLVGGTDELLASGPKGPGSIACDASAAYWAGSGQIRRTPTR